MTDPFPVRMRKLLEVARPLLGVLRAFLAIIELLHRW